MKAPYPYANAPRLPEQGPIDPRTLVSANAGVELEIGPGRGGFVFERLAVSPDIAMVGLEIRRKWASVVDERLRASGFGERARVFAEDASVVVPRFVDSCVTHVYVHFPDPWWKKRHHKRRVVTPEFVRQAERVLQPGGMLLLQTDVLDRADAFAALLRSSGKLVPVGEDVTVEDHPFVARSPRERRAMADGNPIARLLYRRVD